MQQQIIQQEIKPPEPIRVFGSVRKTQIIIGCGMPRTGTGSLQKLLNGCKGFQIEHEALIHLPFKFDRNKLYEKLEIIHKLTGNYVGDIGHYYLNYLDYLIKFKHARIICMKREKNKVIKSMKATMDWSPYRQRSVEGSEAFPHIPKSSFALSASIHYEMYYHEIHRLKRKYPSRIMIFHVKELNEREGIHRLFNFLKIEKEDRVYNVGIREHKNLGL